MKLMFTDYELCSLFLIIWIFTKIINELQLWKMYKRSIQKLHENGIRFLVRAIIKTEYLNFFLFYSTYWEKLFLWEKEKSAVVFLSKLTYDTYILILSSYYFKADQLLFFYEADVKELHAVNSFQCLMKSIRAQTLRERFMYSISWFFLKNKTTICVR